MKYLNLSVSLVIAAVLIACAKAPVPPPPPLPSCVVYQPELPNVAYCQGVQANGQGPCPCSLPATVSQQLYGATDISAIIRHLEPRVKETTGPMTASKRACARRKHAVDVEKI